MQNVAWRGWRVAKLELAAQELARWSAIALGFSIMVSTALDNVLMVLLLIGWLGSGRWSDKIKRVRGNPVALSGLALAALGVAGALWSSGAPADIELFASKYDKLLLLPIVGTVLIDPEDRKRAVFSMATALTLTLLLSFALWLGALPDVPFIQGHRYNPNVFKNYLTQNVLMAYGALVFFVLARRSQSISHRAFWVIASVLASINVLFMVHGRTGYLVLAAMVLIALFQTLRWRGVLLAVGSIALVCALGFASSGAFRERMELAIKETENWNPAEASTTSVGQRLEFYRNTVEMIRTHPIIGLGTGGFPKAYATMVAGTDRNVARNPHSQYLLITAELGVIGLFAFLFFLFQHARTSVRLADPTEQILARGSLALMLVGCLFNSFLLDHTEGVFFCWLTGMLFAGLPPAELRERARSGTEKV
jgi:O-antigen ligase